MVWAFGLGWSGLGWMAAQLSVALDHQRGALFPWVPVMLACGIGLYFGLEHDPSSGELAAVGLLSLAAALLAWRFRAASTLGMAVMLGIAVIGFGLVLADWRSRAMAAPVLDWRYYGPVEGRLVGLDRSATDRLRLTLAEVRLDGVAPRDVPARVRISIASEGQRLQAGARLMTTAHLSGARGAAEPGGFDFRRHLWFQQIGAVGYTRAPVLVAAPPDGQGRIFALRRQLSASLQARLPGDVGGFAAAVTTGDRSGVTRDALAALRGSNLAHLLAISGLHMGLLAGFVYASLRMGLAAVPYIALRWPLRRLAALGALAAASCYLAMSGGNVATERAFVMVSVALVAVIADRRALTIRAVAVAALIVLLLRPEALLSPGFQMSFAATIALVAVFEALRNLDLPRMPRLLRGVSALVVSSAVAGLATAPIGAAHFNTMSHYGLLANLLSVPLMGALIIPAAVAAAVLAPLGLEMLALVPMGWGISWILAVADFVAGLPGAQGHVAAPLSWALPLLAVGLLWVILWQGRWRWAGLGPAVLALAVWQIPARPDILIDGQGGLVGVMTPEGRALSRAKGSGFVAGVWLENDGDGATQAQAAARWLGDSRLQRIDTAAGPLTHVIGKTGLKAWSGCRAGEIVVVNLEIDRAAHSVAPGCLLLDPPALAQRGGALAWSKGRSQGRWSSARQISGTRRWAAP